MAKLMVVRSACAALRCSESMRSTWPFHNDAEEGKLAAGDDWNRLLSSFYVLLASAHSSLEALLACK